MQQPGTLQEPFGWGDAGLNLPEFAWLISCASVAGHYSFQCPKAMPFGYLYAVGSGELIIRLVEPESSNANMAIEQFQCDRCYQG